VKYTLDFRPDFSIIKTWPINTPTRRNLRIRNIISTTKKKLLNVLGCGINNTQRQEELLSKGITTKVGKEKDYGTSIKFVREKYLQFQKPQCANVAVEGMLF